MVTETAELTRPVVLLDVDGVLNHWVPRSMRRQHSMRGLDLRTLDVGGFSVLVPTETEALAVALCAVTEVLWCTAWRHYANRHLGPRLGMPDLEVIADVRGSQGADWKAAEVRARVPLWLEAGRSVYWIEDFAGSWLVPGAARIPGVRLIDTTEVGHLTKEHLPGELAVLVEGVLDGG